MPSNHRPPQGLTILRNMPSASAPAPPPSYEEAMGLPAYTPPAPRRRIRVPLSALASSWEKRTIIQLERHIIYHNYINNLKEDEFTPYYEVRKGCYNISNDWDTLEEIEDWNTDEETNAREALALLQNARFLGRFGTILSRKKWWYVYKVMTMYYETFQEFPCISNDSLEFSLSNDLLELRILYYESETTKIMDIGGDGIASVGGTNEEHLLPLHLIKGLRDYEVEAEIQECINHSK